MKNPNLIHAGFVIDKECLQVLKNYSTSHGNPGLSASLRMIITDWARMKGQSVIVPQEQVEASPAPTIVLGQGVQDEAPF